MDIWRSGITRENPSTWLFRGWQFLWKKVLSKLFATFFGGVYQKDTLNDKGGTDAYLSNMVLCWSVNPLLFVLKCCNQEVTLAAKYIKTWHDQNPLQSVMPAQLIQNDIRYHIVGARLTGEAWHCDFTLCIQTTKCFYNYHSNNSTNLQTLSVQFNIWCWKWSRYFCCDSHSLLHLYHGNISKMSVGTDVFVLITQFFELDLEVCSCSVNHFGSKKTTMYTCSDDLFWKQFAAYL